ncbi:MAG: dephospho-CoA kinase [Pseudomonadota bacterium]
MLKIGLTGGIGSGKTTVANLFKTFGIPVIDADEIAHSLVEPGQPSLQEIASAFGADTLDESGRLDRDKLRRHVFESPAERKRLESILHPLVFAEIEERIHSLISPYVILCVPLLIETQQTRLVDRVLVVDCPPELQYKRVQSRNNMDRTQFSRILQAQASRTERLAAADDIIVNDAGISKLEAQVEKFHKFYLAMPP